MKKLLLPFLVFVATTIFAQAGPDSTSLLPTTTPILEKFDLSAYPNPVNDVLEITSNLTQSLDLWVTVSGSSGQIVRRDLWKNNGGSFKGAINTSGIPGGIYTIQLSNGSNSVFQKIVIVH